MTAKLVTAADFRDICRTCLSGENLSSIHASTNGLKIEFLLEFSVLIKIADSEQNLPQKICETCLNNLLQIYQFKKQCQENASLLNVLWENAKKEQLEKNGGKPLVPKIQCPYCQKFIAKNGMYKHTRLHTTGKPYHCEICPFRCNHPIDLARHKMAHSGDRPFKCKNCGKGYMRKFSLQEHQKKCGVQAGRLDCDICGLDFTTSAYLQNHLKRHEEKNSEVELEEKVERNFVCELCGKAFSKRQFLARHRQSHIKTFLCNECGKSFSTSSLLKLHMRVHNGEKPYQCRHCKKSFPSHSGLSIHKKSHLGLKAHSCNVCQLKFGSPTQLRVHMRTHTGERPYKCTICDKAFAVKNTLDIHTRIHTHDFVYLCKICGEGFIHKPTLKRHMIHKHKDQTIIKGENP